MREDDKVCYLRPLDGTFWVPDDDNGGEHVLLVIPELGDDRAAAPGLAGASNEVRAGYCAA